jgi:hypothetical protein
MQASLMIFLQELCEELEQSKSLTMRRPFERALSRLSSSGTEVVTGTRLPYELMSTSAESDDEGDLSDGNRPASNRDDTAAEPETELQLRLSSITDILNGLYSLSFQIHSFSSKFKSQKAARYTEIDPDTDIDLFSSYAFIDRRHVDEVFGALRAATGGS